MTRQQQLAGLDTTQKCWRLYAEHGLSMSQVAAELGITKGAVCKAVKRAEALAIESIKGSVEVHKATVLNQLQWTYAEARAAWERSKEGSTKKRSSQREGDRGTSRTATVATDDQPGDPRYLKEALKALEGIRKLLGLDAPQKFQPVDPLRPFDDVPSEQLYRQLDEMLVRAGVRADTLVARGPERAQ